MSVEKRACVLSKTKDLAEERAVEIRGEGGEKSREERNEWLPRSEEEWWMGKNEWTGLDKQTNKGTKQRTRLVSVLLRRGEGGEAKEV